MDAYVYQAALLCPDCAEAIRSEIAKERAVDELVLGPKSLCYDDSDYWPQGPYARGGGEADTPQHCDHCDEFLYNPLTDDGADYVRETLWPYMAGISSASELVQRLEDAVYLPMLPGTEKYRPNYEVLAEWARFYDWIWKDGDF